MEKFYFLNVTNADDVMEGDKPKLRDVGPYAVRKQKTRELQRAPLAAARAARCSPAAPHPPCCDAAFAGFDDALGEVAFDEWQYMDWDEPLTGAGLSPLDRVTTVNVPYAMMRSTLLPDATGAQVDADVTVQAAVGYYVLNKTLGTALAGGPNSVWTVNKDPSVSFCASADCGTHGNCLELGVCECTGGYTGPQCRDAPDKCAGVECTANGLCNRITGACECTNRYFGDRCQYPPSSEDCSAGEHVQDSCRDCCMLRCANDQTVSLTQSECSYQSHTAGTIDLPCENQATTSCVSACNNQMCSEQGTSMCRGAGLSPPCTCNTGFAGDQCDKCAYNYYGASCDPPTAYTSVDASVAETFDVTQIESIVAALLPESVAFGGRPGTKIALFLDPPADAPTSEDVGGLGTARNAALRAWLRYQIEQLVAGELANEMLLTTRTVSSLLYGYSMHPAFVNMCEGWCAEPEVVSDWASQGLLGASHHNRNHTLAGRRSPTFARKRSLRHNTGTLTIADAWSISMRDNRRTVNEWPGNGPVAGKDPEYGYLAPRLTQDGFVKESALSHTLWVERALRAVEFRFQSTEMLGGIEALLYTMDESAWQASFANRENFGVTAEWDPSPASFGGTWPLQVRNSGCDGCDECCKGVRLPGCSYSMPYAFAKPPFRLGHETPADTTRRTRHKSTGKGRGDAEHLTWVGMVDYDHRESMMPMRTFSHAGTVNETTVMNPPWAGLNSYMLVEPITGFILEAAVRLQLNVELVGTGVCVVRLRL